MKGIGKDTVWLGLRTEFCSYSRGCSEAFLYPTFTNEANQSSGGLISEFIMQM